MGTERKVARTALVSRLDTLIKEIKRVVAIDIDIDGGYPFLKSYEDAEDRLIIECRILGNLELAKALRGDYGNNEWSVQVDLFWRLYNFYIKRARELVLENVISKENLIDSWFRYE